MGLFGRKKREKIEPLPVLPQTQNDVKDENDEIIAVISAAICAYFAATSAGGAAPKFKINSFKRVFGATAWSKASIDDQMSNIIY